MAQRPVLRAQSDKKRISGQYGNARAGLIFPRWRGIRRMGFYGGNNDEIFAAGPRSQDLQGVLKEIAGLNTPFLVDIADLIFKILAETDMARTVAPRKSRPAAVDEVSPATGHRAQIVAGKTGALQRREQIGRAPLVVVITEPGSQQGVQAACRGRGAGVKIAAGKASPRQSVKMRRGFGRNSAIVLVQKFQIQAFHSHKNDIAER